MVDDRSIRKLTDEAQAGHGCTIAHLLDGIDSKEMMQAFMAIGKQNDADLAAGKKDVPFSIGWLSEMKDGPTLTEFQGMHALTDVLTGRQADMSLKSVQAKSDLLHPVTLVEAKFDANGKLIGETCNQQAGGVKRTASGIPTVLTPTIRNPYADLWDK
jgi:hypothetical protein